MLDRNKELNWQLAKGQHVNFIPMQIENLTPTWVEDDLLEHIGKIAGECYNSSKDRDACIRRALNCIKNGHHSPWEHFNITLKCLMDRGTSHAVVRHRHCAFQQSSTIYQKYQTGISCISLPDIDPCTVKSVEQITSKEIASYDEAYITYNYLISNKMNAARARDVLPNALATNLIITTNVREWMYIMQRRTGGGDAVRMHVFAWLLRKFFEQNYPKITTAFDNYYLEHRI
jgi:thymidylate synthase (FAD)